MDFLELTKKRYSVRSYTSQEVEKEKLDYILECARYAPSAVNKQPWQFIVTLIPQHYYKIFFLST